MPADGLRNFVDSPFTWGAIGMLAGTIGSSLPRVWCFFIAWGFLVTAIVRARGWFWKRILWNALLSLLAAVLLATGSRFVPKPKEPPSVDEIATEVTNRMSAQLKNEPMKATTIESSSASKIAEAVVRKVIPDWQKVVILQTISQFPGQKVLILAGIGDEARAKAVHFRDLFVKAKWKVDGPKPAPLNQMVLDVQLSTDNRLPERSEALAVFSALKSSGVKCRSTFILDPNVPRDLMVLWVGPEMPPGSPVYARLS